MRWMKSVLGELVGLFVEDGSFAAAIAICLAAMWLLAPRLGLPMRWRGPVLLGGLGSILAESVLRYSRKRR